MSELARTRVKICGIRDAPMADAAINAGADALGFVFHPDSPRFIEPAQAWKIVSTMPPMVSSVGLTVNLSVAEVEEIARVCPMDCVQLHGDETVETAQQCGSRLIKAIRYDPKTIDDQLKIWSDVTQVAAILIDGSTGGMGQAFDWTDFVDHCSACATPIILAGGLTSTNVARAVRAVRPFAVDVSSGVETSRGVKDPALIEAFCRAVQETQGD